MKCPRVARWQLMVMCAGLAGAALAQDSGDAPQSSAQQREMRGETPITVLALAARQAKGAAGMVEAAADNGVVEAGDRHCLTQTGSRLIRADKRGCKCAIASGRAYTREDLDRTGSSNLAEALRRLDMSVR